MQLSNEAVLQKCIKMHGSKYDYSKVIYKGANQKIEIICAAHGSFWQVASKHWSGQNCRKCTSEDLRDSVENFIEKAVRLHGRIYDYSKVNYLGAFVKVEIVCPHHGSFWQIPTNHLKKDTPRGCSKCKGGVNLLHDDFIKLAKNNSKFNCEIAGRYVNWLTPVKIYCKHHGESSVLPTTILNGYGCGYCTNKPKRFDQEWFIKKAKAVHGDRYIYLDLNYKNEDISIICPVHGSFRQKAHSHLAGNGCKLCNKGNVSKIETRWLDAIKVPKKCRNKSIRILGKLYVPDGINKKDKVIYEFLGDFWHGNPKRYNPKDLNCIRKQSFGQLYQATMKRLRIFRKAGYKVYYVWEKDFRCGLLFSN